MIPVYSFVPSPPPYRVARSRSSWSRSASPPQKCNEELWEPRPGTGGNGGYFRYTPLRGRGQLLLTGCLKAVEGRAEVTAPRDALVTVFSAPCYVIAVSRLSAAGAGAARNRGPRLPPPQVRPSPSHLSPLFSMLLISSSVFRCSESAVRIPVPPLRFRPRGCHTNPSGGKGGLVPSSWRPRGCFSPGHVIPQGAGVRDSKEEGMLVDPDERGLGRQPGLSKRVGRSNTEVGRPEGVELGIVFGV